ncbi:hypothetical protein ACFOEM_00020 [Paenalcaligenes hominis]|uniref:hypothetical protein n=1 Tax=Paenalcaligenes hominis TaxID=643674 RepID=UPI00361FC203
MLPQEFSEYGFLPSEWVAEDIAMVWVGLILNRFFASSSEVTNLQLLQQLQHDQGAKRGQQLYDQLKWLNDPAAPVIIPERLHSAASPPPWIIYSHYQNRVLRIITTPPA